jgi:hypothetical protein
VESDATEEIDQGCLRLHFLDDFHNCLENPDGFTTATTGPTAVQTARVLKANGTTIYTKFLTLPTRIACFTEVPNLPGIANGSGSIAGAKLSSFLSREMKTSR